MSRIARAAFAWTAAAALIALAASASCVAQTRASDSALASSPASIEFDGTSRTYRIYRPPELAPGMRAPLVMVQHGGFGRGSGAEEQYRWDGPRAHEPLRTSVILTTRSARFPAARRPSWRSRR